MTGGASEADARFECWHQVGEGPGLVTRAGAAPAILVTGSSGHGGVQDKQGLPVLLGLGDHHSGS